MLISPPDRSWIFLSERLGKTLARSLPIRSGVMIMCDYASAYRSISIAHNKCPAYLGAL
nr:hypothetical protein [uncultured bacterium]